MTHLLFILRLLPLLALLTVIGLWRVKAGIVVAGL